MHQIAASIVSLFFSPFNWIVVLLIVAYFVRKKSLEKNINRFVALPFLCIFGNQWLLDKYAKAWQPAPVEIQSSQPYSCGVVLGGFASPDAEANGYFNSASDRFIQTLKLYKTGKISHILVSGGNGKPDEKSFREAYWARKELVSWAFLTRLYLLKTVRTILLIMRCMPGKSLIHSNSNHPTC